MRGAGELPKIPPTPPAGGFALVPFPGLGASEFQLWAKCEDATSHVHKASLPVGLPGT